MTVILLFSYFIFWLCWVFFAAQELSLVAVSSVAVHGLLTAVVSLIAEHRIEAPGLQ